MNEDLGADIAAASRIESLPFILDLVCRTTGMGFAAVARVTQDRWIACGVRDEIAFGLKPGGELKVETTLCSSVRDNRDVIVINDALEDIAYSSHPCPAMYGFRSYISMPIILSDGSFFGTLCAIDPNPAKLDAPDIIGMFRSFAQLIASHLAAARRQQAAEYDLCNERATAEQRERFIAVLGHDLRNPLAAIDAGAQLLAQSPLDERGRMITRRIRSSVGRMAGLIDDVLDFARGRLGGGLALARDDAARLEPVLSQVLAEVQTSFPNQVIETQIRLARPVACDTKRIGQLFSNLLGNAVAYGAPGQPIHATVATYDTMFELSVANHGDAIPPAALDRMFEPFNAGAGAQRQQGLGLGLYICSEIAHAHGGEINVASSSARTTFTFRMPLA